MRVQCFIAVDKRSGRGMREWCRVSKEIFIHHKLLGAVAILLGWDFFLEGIRAGYWQNHSTGLKTHPKMA